MRFVSCLAFLLLSIPAFADDPPPGPVSSIGITVPDGVEGDGKRGTPYVFNTKTKCVLMLPTAAESPTWDLSDGPSDMLVLAGGSAVVFSLETGGEYLVQAKWKDGWSKAWFVIHAGPAPPPTPESLANRVTKALTGPRAREDAVALVAASEKILAGLSEYKDGADLLPAWGVFLSANGWVKGSRPEIAAMIAVEIPSGDAVAFTDESRSRLRALFTAILDGSKAVLK